MSVFCAKDKESLDIDKVCLMARDGQITALKECLSIDREWVHKRDQSGRTIIHWAAVGGHSELVQFLLHNYDVDPDVRDEVNWTPLMIACSAGRLDTVRVLLESGAVVNAINTNGQCPLHYAASKDRLEIADVLLDNGADVNIADKYSSTPLHRASSQGHTRITKLLLANNANPNAADSEGNTALHLACEEEREADARILVQAGSSLTSLNKEEKTPVDVATSAMKKLLKNLSV